MSIDLTKLYDHGAAPPPPVETAADAFYGSSETAASVFAPILSDSLDVLAAHTGASPEEREAMSVRHSEIFHDARIDREEASVLHSQFVQYVKTPADEATRNAWAAETMTELRDRYGASADARLAVAKQFISERPELQQLLSTTGLGSNPKVVLALVERSSSLRLRGAKK